MLGERLSAARKAAKLTQNDVADELGIRRQTYSAYERGVSTPDARTIGVLARMFGVSADSLVAEPSVVKHGMEYCTVPVYRKLFSCAPDGTEENVIGYEEVDSALGMGNALLALRVTGEEMEPRFSDGDVVIIRREEEPPGGAVVAVSVAGEEAVIRKMIRYTDGVRLVPLNPAFEPKYYTQEEMQSLPVTVYGRVAELRAKF